jgi:hypothetical protein
MSFSPDWLALREPADHAARASSVSEKVFAHFAARESMTIIDFGCGTGSNLRAMAAHLPPLQTWRLIDWDENLLAAARASLADWADTAREEAGLLFLQKGDRRIIVETQKADLANDPARLLDGVDLLTATAFFDLVSAAWMDGLCDGLKARHLPLYAILTYDGREIWSPPHAADEAMLAAFHAHQKSDKGFGVASGPDAASHLSQALELRGFRVAQASSPWRLGQGELLRQLAQGAAQAVIETGRVSADDVASWRAARESAASCEIGHIDLFAVPA